MSAFGPKQTWAFALHMSAFGGVSGHGFVRKFLTQPGGNKKIKGLLACRAPRAFALEP